MLLGGGLARGDECRHCAVSCERGVDAAIEQGADRYAWAAHYLAEMGKAVVDDLACGMVANGVVEEGRPVGE